MKEKNRDKDRWRTKVRLPFEGVFKALLDSHFHGNDKLLFISHRFRLKLAPARAKPRIVPVSTPDNGGGGYKYTFGLN